MDKEIKELTSPDMSFEAIESPNVCASITITNIGIIIVRKLEAQVICQKCKRTYLLNTKKQCPCGNNIFFSFVSMVYANGFVGSLELGLADVLLLYISEFIINCLNCTKYFSVKKQNGEFNCFGCNAWIKYKINKVWLKQPKQETKQEHEIVKGCQLPMNGTCKHYKKSFRWYRFPCCNKLFPCDECHNQDSNHIIKQASKMVCGFCSEEQNVAKECKCRKNMGSKGHWNAGKGTRDKSRMSKKDRQKYKK